MCECCQNIKKENYLTYYCSDGKLNISEEYITNIIFPTNTTCIYLPSNINIIPIGSLEFYKTPKFINIPESVKIIDQSAFFNCNIDSLDLSKGITKIEDCAFQESVIKKVKLDFNIIEEIGFHVFGDECVIDGGFITDIRKPNSHPFLNEYTRICQMKKFITSNEYFIIELEFPPGKELYRKIDPRDGEEIYTGFEKTEPIISIKDYSNIKVEIILCTLGGDNYNIPNFFQNNKKLKENAVIYHSDLKEKDTWRIVVPWKDEPIDDLEQKDVLKYFLQNPEYDISEPLLIMWV